MRQGDNGVGVRHSYCAAVPGRVTRVHRRGLWRNQRVDANAGGLVPVFGPFGRAIDEEKGIQKGFRKMVRKVLRPAFVGSELASGCHDGWLPACQRDFPKGFSGPDKASEKTFRMMLIERSRTCEVERGERA